MVLRVAAHAALHALAPLVVLSLLDDVSGGTEQRLPLITKRRKKSSKKKIVTCVKKNMWKKK